MELNQIDLLNLNENDIAEKEIETGHEGSLLEIENPLDRNSSTALQTEAEIENFSTSNKKIKTEIRIPFGFFSDAQQNRTKYNF